MGLLERNQGIARRAEDLAAASARVRAILVDGKREQLLSGVDATGRPFAPLARSTLARKGRRSPSPLLPDGPASGLITGYSVDVSLEPGRMTIDAGWPGRDYVRYLRSGTRRMPARDPGGFRPEDLERCRREVKEHVMGGPDGD
jgi:hypothetical protein